jgi:DNA (cytosine-5)-methyltransferase 1
MELKSETGVENRTEEVGHRVDTSAFNVLSLCSGVGGLELGLKLAVPAARTVCFVEREAYCCEVLAERMEDGCLDEAPIWTDLRTFDGKPWRGVVDCVTGGYPCQPFSVAGKRKGDQDDRHLWPEVARVVREVGPEWCFFENVGNHLRLGFEQAHDELSGMGYVVAAGLFSAEEVGATHKRERLFVVGHAGGRGCGQGIHEPGNDAACSQAYRVRFPVSAACGRRVVSGVSVGTGGTFRPYPPSPDSPTWSEILRDSPELSPAVECDIFGVADGLAVWLDRLRACGNGVVPAVAALAWRTLVGGLSEGAFHTEAAPVEVG